MQYLELYLCTTVGEVYIMLKPAHSPFRMKRVTFGVTS